MGAFRARRALTRARGRPGVSNALRRRPGGSLPSGAPRPPTVSFVRAGCGNAAARPRPDARDGCHARRAWGGKEPPGRRLGCVGRGGERRETWAANKNVAPACNVRAGAGAGLRLVPNLRAEGRGVEASAGRRPRRREILCAKRKSLTTKSVSSIIRLIHIWNVDAQSPWSSSAYPFGSWAEEGRARTPVGGGARTPGCLIALGPTTTGAIRCT